VNLRSVFLCCKYGVQAMIASGGGSIVNLSSVLGLVGVGTDEHFATHAYAAAEAGVIGLTRAMAVYYAPQGVRCNAICPGPIATGSLPGSQGAIDLTESMRWKQPLAGHLGTPEEVTGAALFLASDESRFVTGVILPVDAGWTAQ
jgi:NAD(P)-dependent dehydrogenase (short-subunit alcohol dehydrogenase family)